MDPLTLTDECQRIAESIGEEFLASIYAAETARRPENLDALTELGHVYTRLGRYQEGLEVDERLVELVPEDPTVRYNLACSQCLVGQLDASLESLRVAIALGYKDIRFLRDDEDLERLRGDPRFEALLAEAEAESESESEAD